MLIYTHMTIAMHNHIHLGSTGHTWISIYAKKIVMTKLIVAATRILNVGLPHQNLHGRLFISCILQLAVQVFINDALYVFKHFNQKASTATAWVANKFTFFDIKDIYHILDNSSRCKELP